MSNLLLNDETIYLRIFIGITRLASDPAGVCNHELMQRGIIQIRFLDDFYACGFRTEVSSVHNCLEKSVFTPKKFLRDFSLHFRRLGRAKPLRAKTTEVLYRSLLPRAKRGSFCIPWQKN